MKIVNFKSWIWQGAKGCDVNVSCQAKVYPAKDDVPQEYKHMVVGVNLEITHIFDEETLCQIWPESEKDWDRLYSAAQEAAR